MFNTTLFLKNIDTVCIEFAILYVDVIPGKKFKQIFKKETKLISCR